MEQTYSDVATAGHMGGFIVVPEFKLRYDLAGQRRAKKADVAWLVTHDNPAPGDDLLPYKVVAVFEVEGFDVPLATISLHSEVYPRVREHVQSEFPCYVPLYSLATHRPGYGVDNVNLVQQCVLDRQNIAAQHHNVIEVCDGAQRDWLDRAREVATTLAHAWLQQH